MAELDQVSKALSFHLKALPRRNAQQRRSRVQQSLSFSAFFSPSVCSSGHTLTDGGDSELFVFPSTQYLLTIITTTIYRCASRC